MRFADEVMIQDGRPWGNGAVQITNAPVGYCCGLCQKRAKLMSIFADGDICCGPCAKTWCDEHWPAYLAAWL